MIASRHIDGHDYMYALSEILDSAKEAIFIMGWWITPELYLRRPPAFHQEWRLDKLLKRKAQEGVKIFIIVYEEVNDTLCTLQALAHADDVADARSHRRCP
jgi:phospholipase D1/2